MYEPAEFELVRGINESKDFQDSAPGVHEKLAAPVNTPQTPPFSACPSIPTVPASCSQFEG
jgi:hypothetical protein